MQIALTLFQLFTVLTKFIMMLAAFKATLASEEPSILTVPLLIVLWRDVRKNWENAHEISQAVHTAHGSWLSAPQGR